MFTKVLVATAVIAMRAAEAQTKDVLAQNKYEVGWFKGETYTNMTKEGKMEELWSMCVPDPNVVEEPSPYKWADFKNFFTTLANGSFCQRADEHIHRI